MVESGAVQLFFVLLMFFSLVRVCGGMETLEGNFEGTGRIEYFEYDPSNLSAGARYFSSSVNGVRFYNIRVAGECSLLQMYVPNNARNKVILDGSCAGQGSQIHQYVYQWDQRYQNWCLRNETTGERGDFTSETSERLINVKVKGCIPFGSGKD